MFFASHAVHAMWIVANVNESVSSVAARVQESVGAGAEQGLALVAPGRLVVQVAKFLVRLGPGFAPAVLVAQLVGVGPGGHWTLLLRPQAGRRVLGIVALVNGIVVGIVVQEVALRKLICREVRAAVGHRLGGQTPGTLI